MTIDRQALPSSRVKKHLADSFGRRYQLSFPRFIPADNPFISVMQRWVGVCRFYAFINKNRKNRQIWTPRIYLTNK